MFVSPDLVRFSEVEKSYNSEYLNTQNHAQYYKSSVVCTSGTMSSAVVLCNDIRTTRLDYKIIKTVSQWYTRCSLRTWGLPKR